VLQYNNVGRNLPRVSDVKGVDIYMFSCIAFIFFTLIELAIAGYVERYGIAVAANEAAAAAAAKPVGDGGAQKPPRQRSPFNNPLTSVKYALGLSACAWA